MTDSEKKLELALAELRRREDHEDDREKTANSKLTSTLVALPIIISLSTTAFFTLLIYAVRFGWVGAFATLLFVGAVTGFMAAAIMAIIGLWPMRAKYRFIGLRTIARFPEDKTYEQFVQTLIAERVEAVRENGRVNAEKLGMYALSSTSMVAGLGLLAIVVIIFAIAGFTSPDRLQSPGVVSSGSPSASSRPISISSQQIGPKCAQASSNLPPICGRMRKSTPKCRHANLESHVRVFRSR